MELVKPIICTLVFGQTGNYLILVILRGKMLWSLHIIIVLTSHKGGVYMNPIIPTCRASPLARTNFHPHFTWDSFCRHRSGKNARGGQVSTL